MEGVAIWRRPILVGEVAGERARYSPKFLDRPLRLRTRVDESSASPARAIDEAPIERDDVVVKVEVVGGPAGAIVGVDNPPKEVDRLVDRVDALVGLQLGPQGVEDLVGSGRSPG